MYLNDKKYLLSLMLACMIAIFGTDTHADIGINAGVLAPAAKFDHVADTGYGVGSHIKFYVYENVYYGLALNFTSADGNNGVDFRQVGLYPFIDWFFFRKNNLNVFARGGIGLSRWESDGIWWLDDQGNNIATTFGLGCQLPGNFDILAGFTNIYADFDIPYFQIRLGCNFDIED